MKFSNNFDLTTYSFASMPLCFSNTCRWRVSWFLNTRLHILHETLGSLWTFFRCNSRTVTSFPHILQRVFLPWISFMWRLRLASIAVLKLQMLQACGLIFKWQARTWLVSRNLSLNMDGHRLHWKSPTLKWRNFMCEATAGLDGQTFSQWSQKYGPTYFNLAIRFLAFRWILFESFFWWSLLSVGFWLETTSGFESLKKLSILIFIKSIQFLILTHVPWFWVYLQL